MKHKWYFCDWVEEHINPGFLYIPFILVLLIITLINLPNVYEVYNKEVVTVTAEDYDILEKSAERAYDSYTKTIDVSRLYDDVKVKNIVMKDDKLTFKCVLDKDFSICKNPYISVKVTDNFKKMQITEEKHTCNFFELLFKSFLEYGIYLCIAYFIFLFIFYVALKVSIYNKDKNY